ncbi:hypothetical protein WMF39_43945 [Sorangium sp. So ce1504]|uniref:hypothetical protein n=1 Tax=Sorangium sp. So ce1504 TaxID=3133337 RepID=UPI003F5EE448
MATAGRPAALVAALLGAVLLHGTARAEPQASAGVTVGLAGVGLDRQLWDSTVFHLGLRGDVLFGRAANDDFGVGPYAEVLTHAFDEIQTGAGVSVLVPIHDSFPLVLFTGAYGRWSDDARGVEPGIAAAIFWGGRSYNFHSRYGMSTGLLAQGRFGLGGSKETAVVLAAQLDLALLALPFVYLFEAAKGPSPEAAPVHRARPAR